MAELSRFFDGVQYTETEFAEVWADMFVDGVLRDKTTVGDKLVVSQQGAGAMAVNVAAGRAIVQGFWYKNTGTASVAIAANSSGSTRIDYVVLKLDRAANTVVLAVHQGVGGAGAPALTRVAGGTWEIALARITVANGAVSILTASIADTRGDPTLCGYTGDWNWRDKLAYLITTDVNNFTAMTANTWTDIGVSQNVTLDLGWPSTTMMLILNIACLVGNIANYMGGRILVDGATSFQMGGNYSGGAGVYANPFAGNGVLAVTGLAAGVHTVKIQAISGGAAQLGLLGATLPNFFFARLKAFEFPTGAGA